MKPFNVTKALAGKPVRTQDGRKAEFKSGIGEKITMEVEGLGTVEYHTDGSSRYVKTEHWLCIADEPEKVEETKEPDADASKPIREAILLNIEHSSVRTVLDIISYQVNYIESVNDLLAPRLKKEIQGLRTALTKVEEAVAYESIVSETREKIIQYTQNFADSITAKI